MDKRSNIGFIVGIAITGVSLIVFRHLQFGIGVGLLIFIGVWASLTLPKWGYLRKRWESKVESSRFFHIGSSGDIAFGKPGENGFAKGTRGESLILRLHVEFWATPPMLVESVKLGIMGRRILSNWEPVAVGTFRGQYIYFGVPNWVKSGRHKVRLVASGGGKEWSSEKFSILFPRL